MSSKNYSKYDTNLCSASRKNIIYLATIPHIFSASSEQTHHTLVSYLKMTNIIGYNKSLSYIALELIESFGFNGCSIN